ncbi:mechanosensitive ion channel family protein [Teredinibacter purpureus]|uniref:mechanosensitive ion channel family protein n=1 Tax=Teredinibacter purpureus TaxID=2731756 RepID=UPI000695BF2C|nr:mechanosensitive ion channel family protein [Teredinibacter purpureus]
METELQQINAIYQLITKFLVDYSFQLVGAILVFLLGLFIAGKIGKAVQRFAESRGVDITLSRFIGSTVKMISLVMVIIIVLGKLGISVTPFVAAVGALTFGVSLAAQGLISNYGAGVNIIIGRPFVVGDTISICGVSGVVTEVNLGHTLLINEDHVTITIPNKHIIGEILHNSKQESLVEMSIGVAYSSNMDDAVRVITQAINESEGFSSTTPPIVGIENFGDSSVNIGIRYKVPTASLFNVQYQVNRNIFTSLHEADINIPFPQAEVRML